jgi:uncharacterized membrane protein YgdD (TMEM256/DUF423 family)
MGALAVIVGAFGAHGVDSYFEKKYAGAPEKNVTGLTVPASWKYMQDYKTGVDYHFYHVMGLLAVGLMLRGRKSAALEVAGWCFLSGIVLFSGSLYALTLTGQTWWGMVAPIGGTALIAGWVALAVGSKSEVGNRKSEEMDAE